VREKRRKKGRRARRAAASPEADELHHRRLMDDLRHPALLRFGTGKETEERDGSTVCWDERDEKEREKIKNLTNGSHL
jgi:hypothetical protein